MAKDFEQIVGELLRESGANDHSSLRDDLLFEIASRGDGEIETARENLENGDVRSVLIARQFFGLPVLC